VQQEVAIRSPRRRGLAMCQVQSVRPVLRLMAISILVDWYTGRPQDQSHSSLSAARKLGEAPKGIGFHLEDD